MPRTPAGVKDSDKSKAGLESGADARHQATECPSWVVSTQSPMFKAAILPTSRPTTGTRATAVIAGSAPEQPLRPTSTHMPSGRILGKPAPWMTAQEESRGSAVGRNLLSALLARPLNPAGKPPFIGSDLIPTPWVAVTRYGSRCGNRPSGDR